MKTTTCKWAVATAAFLAGLSPWVGLRAQGSEALLDALMRKGILTEQEAEDIKADLFKENRQYIKVRSLGKETASLDIYGDFRGRYEGFFSDDPEMVDRHRFRYRLRLGLTATLTDRFEAGLRLGSGDVDSGIGSGLDPISNNQSFQNNGSKKGIFIDLAYGRWYALSNQTFLSTLTVGKMENPFVFSDMVFDGDYTPEGVAIQSALNFNLDHALKFNLGAFVLDEINGQSEDPYLFGGQVRFDSTWKYSEAHAPKIQTSLGASLVGLYNAQNLTNGAVPNINRGNTRTGATGELASAFYPIVGDASLTYTLDKMMWYNGPFPIKLGGDVAYNFGADDRNWAYSVGVIFGKSGKRGTWDLSYRWKYLGADAWFEELVDSDFGAFYTAAAAPGSQAPLNSGGGTGYGAGTNVKGHIIKASYSPYAAITLGVTWFKTQLISESAAFTASGDSDMNRLQVDAVWKF